MFQGCLWEGLGELLEALLDDLWGGLGESLGGFLRGAKRFWPLRPPIGLIFEPFAITRRDLTDPGDGFGLKRPMARDRHPAIFQMLPRFGLFHLSLNILSELLVGFYCKKLYLSQSGLKYL